MTDISTARGDRVEAGDLGFTLVSEIIFNVNTDISNNWPDIGLGSGEQLDRRIEQAIERLREAGRHGVETIVDRVLPGQGRNVANVKRIAQEVPVNIVVCTGWYTWVELPHQFLFREIWGLTEPNEPTLEDLFVRDVEEGIADTGVRAGLIKFATDHYGLTPSVEHIMRSAARAHRRTGVPITTHTGQGTVHGKIQQQLLEEEGVDLSRVIIGHIDKTPRDTPIDEFAAVMDRGSYLAFDMVGIPDFASEGKAGEGKSVTITDSDLRVNRIVELCERGYADRIMVSHDQCCWSDLLPEPMLIASDERKGVPPYTQVHHQLIPALRERGVSDQQIEQITVVNPRTLFETTAAGPY